MTLHFRASLTSTTITIPFSSPLNPSTSYSFPIPNPAHSNLMSSPSTHSHWVIPEPISTGFDALTLVKDVSIPKPGPGQVLIRVKAVSLNYRDLVLAKQKYWGEKSNVRSFEPSSLFP